MPLGRGDESLWVSVLAGGGRSAGICSAGGDASFLVPDAGLAC